MLPQLNKVWLRNWKCKGVSINIVDRNDTVRLLERLFLVPLLTHSKRSPPIGASGSAPVVGAIARS